MANLRRFFKRQKIKRQFRGSAVGSADWLAGLEVKYGGKSKVKFKPRDINPLDFRAKLDLSKYRHVGGDRMSNLINGYGEIYQQYLEPYVQRRLDKYTICEIGILQGTGLAIWCDLFPNSRIIGLDIDLRYFNENYEHLRQLGAFAQNSPEIHQFDQFDTNNTEQLQEILTGESIDICIDDACHIDEAILNTLECLSPHLNKNFVYFVEDNKNVHVAIESLHKHFKVKMHDRGGGLTVLTNY